MKRFVLGAEGAAGERSSARNAFWLLLAVAIAARLAIFFVYTPAVFPDTGTYRTLADQLLHFDFSGYRGLRTPGYPMLFIIADGSYAGLWAIQSALGLAVTFLLFHIALVHTGSGRWALAAGLAHTLALNQLFCEPAMLSETFATFLVTLSVAGLLASLRRERRGVATGFVAGLATLTRPLYVFMGPLFVVLVLVFERGRLRLAAGMAIAFAVVVLGWCGFNQATIGYFGLSAMAGYSLVNHSGRFMEDAGEEYATIRDVFLKYRGRKIAETGRPAMAIFMAREEMLERTGLDEVALSRRLAALSRELILQHPGKYLEGVIEAWASFWAAPLYDRAEAYARPGAARWTGIGWRIERVPVLLMNLVAVVASVLLIARAVWRRLQGATGLSAPLIISFVLMGAATLQALVELGENPRYGIPTQSLALLLVLLVARDACAVWARRAKRRAPSAYRSMAA